MVAIEGERQIFAKLWHLNGENNPLREETASPRRVIDKPRCCKRGGEHIQRFGFGEVDRGDQGEGCHRAYFPSLRHLFEQ